MTPMFDENYKPTVSKIPSNSKLTKKHKEHITIAHHNQIAQNW